MTSPYTGSATTATDLSGNNSVDSLLADVKWGGAVGQSANLSYSFFNSTQSYYASDYGYGEYLAAFALSTAQITAVTSGLNAWSSVANLTFSKTTDSSTNAGDLRFGGYSDMPDDAFAWAYYPSSLYAEGGDTWFGPDVSKQNLAAGSYDYSTILHEIGHALGLKHSFETEDNNGNVLPGATDDTRHTVMTYTQIYDFEPTGPMLYDIAAIQYLYGANNNWNTGNNTYKWDSNAKVFETIWDAGGIDTLDASNQTRAVKLNLNSGEFSHIGQDIHDYTNEVSVARNDFLTIAYGATIENAIGSNYNDRITGNAFGNVLDGKAGADTLIGGAGDDTYIVDNTGDILVEDQDRGTDLVKVAIAIANGSYTLAANIENGILTNTVAFSLEGNNLANQLTGNAAVNTLIGGAGNDTLDGKAGADILLGGVGDDTYIVDNVGDIVSEADGDGTDLVKSSVSYTLGADIENLTLLGRAAINATGNEGDNVLTGNDGANVLDGKAGADTMSGGKGNDTYIVDDASDVVSELLTAAQGGGIDTVKSTIDYVLGNNLDNLTLTGSEHLNGTGNELANTLTGNDGNNTLDGIGGIDKLIGGKGNDTYIVDLTAAGKLQDIITERATTTTYDGGVDSVVLRGTSSNTSAVTLTVTANTENLDASATGFSKLNLTGSGAANVLIGNNGANVINGGAGNDTLAGMGGLDTLTGGAGADTFRFDLIGNLGKEFLGSITDFSHAAGDLINLTSIANFTFMTEGMAIITDGAPINQVYLDNGVLHGSMDGGHTQAFDIQLIGITALLSSDFTPFA
jgi:serralysin